MVASGQPCLVVGDLNDEPTKIPCLLKGISAGLWFDLHASRAVASGAIPVATCMHSFHSTGGTRRDFIIGCPLAASALSWCRVLGERWVLPHHALRASFGLGAWTSRSRQVALYSALQLASWVFFFFDKTRSSKSAAVRRVSLVLSRSSLWLPLRPETFRRPGACGPSLLRLVGSVLSCWLAALRPLVE